jgi:hypothetical protein
MRYNKRLHPDSYSSTGGSSSTGGGGGTGSAGGAGAACGAKQFPNRKPLRMPPMMHMIQQSTTSITAIRMKMTRITVNAIATRMAMSQQPQTLQQRHHQMHGFVAPHHRVNVGTKTVHTW